MVLLRGEEEARALAAARRAAILAAVSAYLFEHPDTGIAFVPASADVPPIVSIGELTEGPYRGFYRITPAITPRESYVRVSRMVLEDHDPEALLKVKIVELPDGLYDFQLTRVEKAAT